MNGAAIPILYFLQASFLRKPMKIDQVATHYRTAHTLHGVSVSPTRIAAILLIALFATSPSLSGAARAASVWFVAATGSDATGDGSVSNPFATITHAVASAAAGDTILVSPGTYHEMVNITKHVTIQSLSSDPSNTIVDATGLSMGFFVLGSAAAGTVISGFSVQNANNHGIYAQDTSKVIFEHNVVTRNGQNPTSAFSGEDKAVELVGTSYSSIVGNTVIDNLYGGIAINDNGPINPGFYSPGSLLPSIGNVISGNTVVGNRPHHCSIVVSAYDAGAGVFDTIVSSNVIVDNSAGVVIAADVPNSEVANTTVAFNTILNNGEAGIVLHDNGLGGRLSGTVVMGNTLSGNGIPVNSVQNKIIMIGKFTGILVGGEDTKVAPDNTFITGNVIENQYYGVYIVNGTSTTILGNDMGSTVSVQVGNGTLTEDPTTVQVDQLKSTIGTLQNDIAQLQSSAAKSSDVDQMSATLNSVSASLSQIRTSLSNNTSVNAGQVSDLKGNVDSLSSELATTSYFAYAALGIAIIASALVIAISRRPSPK